MFSRSHLLLFLDYRVHLTSLSNDFQLLLGHEATVLTVEMMFHSCISGSWSSWISMKRAVMQMLFLSIEVMGELKSKTKMRNMTRQCSVENPSEDTFSWEVCITNSQRITLCVQKQTKSLITEYFKSTTDGRKRGNSVISLLRKLNLYQLTLSLDWTYVHVAFGLKDTLCHQPLSPAQVQYLHYITRFHPFIC